MNNTMSMAVHGWTRRRAQPWLKRTACISSTWTPTFYHGILLPTLNYEHPDAECDLDYVPHYVRYHKVKVALFNSFGLGDTNAKPWCSRREVSKGAVLTSKRVRHGKYQRAQTCGDSVRRRRPWRL